MRQTIQRSRLKRIDPIRKCHVKKGDTVIVLSGTEKGSIGQVNKVIKKYSKLIVKGINIKKVKIYDFTKKTKKGKYEFNIVARECPIHIAKVMFYDNETNTKSKLGRTIVDGVKKRLIKKTGVAID